LAQVQVEVRAAARVTREEKNKHRGQIIDLREEDENTWMDVFDWREALA
jgi:hypothetical protein